MNYLSVHTETNRETKEQRLICYVDDNNILTPVVLSMLDVTNCYRIEYIHLLRIAKLIKVDAKKVIQLLTKAMQEYKKQNAKETFTFTFNIPKHN